MADVTEFPAYPVPQGPSPTSSPTEPGSGDFAGSAEGRQYAVLILDPREKMPSRRIGPMTREEAFTRVHRMAHGDDQLTLAIESDDWVLKVSDAEYVIFRYNAKLGDRQVRLLAAELLTPVNGSDLR